MLKKDIKKILKMNPEYKGEGIRVAVIENSVSKDGMVYYEDIIGTPIDLYGANHGEKSGESWNTFKPSAKVYSLPPIDQSVDWILENNIDIVTMSLSDSHISLSNIIKMSKKCFIITSGGNSGDEGETMRDNHGKYWFQVGVVDEDLKPKKYSSRGRDMIDGATFTDLEMENNTYGGTSGGCQLYGILIAEYFEAHNQIFGVKPSIKQTIDFIDKHSHNTQILDQDSDLKMGYGFLVLPEEYHFKKIEIRFPFGESESYDTALIFENGQYITNEKLLLKAFINSDNLTSMGVRDLSDISGNFIRWNDEFKKIEIFIQQGDH